VEVLSIPDYRTHYVVNTLTIVIISIYTLFYHYLNIIELGIFIVAYTIGTEFMSPDVDVKSTPYNKNKLLWYPYRKLSKHRGISHSIIGIFIRLLYVSAIIIIISLLFNQFDVLIDFLLNIKIMHYALFISGITLSNVMHILIDRFF